MKNFVYFKESEGGMDIIKDIKTEKDLTFLLSWMLHCCEVDDRRLVQWMDQAKVGEMHEHRLGVLVRMKNK